MDMKAWHYFLGLEREFASTTHYVEPVAENFKTYSDRFAGLLLMIGSEVDVVAKLLSSRIDHNAKRSNMGECQKVIYQLYPLHEVVVQMPRYKMMFTPWQAWGLETPGKPEWWDAYNAVKHDRLEQRHRASQRSVMDSLAGLFVLNMYLYAELHWPQPYPELFDCGFPEYLVNRSTAERLPGL